MKEYYDSFNCDVPIVLNKLKDCPGQRLCSKCDWYVQNRGYCPGCNEDYKKRCIKGICAFTSCINCSGGMHAKEIGICGRAPESWRKRWNKLLEYSIREYTPEPLNINCRLIPLIYAQIKKYKMPEKFPQIDAWAVPIHKVADRKGKFRSSDLKDYLGLPSNKKLILSTCSFDDYEELLWKIGPKINFNQYGIDYWFPAHFSIYDDDSKICQFANAKRQQLHAVWTQSQFVWFRLGEHIPIEFLALIRNAPSVLISTNQMFRKQNKTILNKEVKAADSWFQPKTAFFIIGKYKNLPVSHERTCYQIDSNWLIKALKGSDIEGKKVMSITREKLLINNLEGVLEYVYSTKD
jgi:hypothetical protein